MTCPFVQPNVVVISPTQVPEQRFVCSALLYGRVWRVVSTARRRGPRPIPPPQVVSGLRDSPEIDRGSRAIEAGLIDVRRRRSAAG